MKHARKLFLAIAIAAAASAAARDAGGVGVEGRLHSAQIFEGESVAYDVRVSNANGNVRPDMSDFKGDFAVGEPQMSQESSVMITFNGRNVSSSTVYRYELTPKRAGNLTVPAPFVTVDGRKVAGRPLALHVVAEQKQDIVIVKIETTRQRVVPYQRFDVNLKIMVKPLPLDDRDPLSLLAPPTARITWRDPIPGLNTTVSAQEWLGRLITQDRRAGGIYIEGITDMFGQVPFNLYSRREKRAGLDGKEYNYFVYELKRTFIPVRSGSFSFGPAIVKGEFVDGVDAGRTRYTKRPLAATASAISVDAAPPEPKPANFNGCYGRFSLRASANAADLRVGDPLTLKLDFERASNAGLLEEVTAPDLTVIKELTENFNVLDKSPPGQTKGNVKSYSYVLRPKKAGVSIAPITVSAFNTDKDQFEEMTSNPIALNVTDAPQLRPDELVSASPANAARRISGQEKGVFQNISEPAEIRTPALNATNYWMIVGGLWIAYAAGAVALTIHRRRAGDEILQNRLRARNEAAAQLESARVALKSGDGSAAALGVQRAVTGLIGHWNAIPPSGMTAQEAAAILEKSGASPESRTEAARVLDSIEAAKYGSVAGMQAAALVESAEKLIQKLQKELESKRA